MEKKRNIIICDLAKVDKKVWDNVRIILEVFEVGDDISIPLIQRKCKIGYNASKEVFDYLVDVGKIAKGEGTKVSVFL